MRSRDRVHRLPLRILGRGLRSPTIPWCSLAAARGAKNSHWFQPLVTRDKKLCCGSFVAATAVAQPLQVRRLPAIYTYASPIAVWLATHHHPGGAAALCIGYALVIWLRIGYRWLRGVLTAIEVSTTSRNARSRCHGYRPHLEHTGSDPFQV